MFENDADSRREAVAEREREKSAVPTHARGASRGGENRRVRERCAPLAQGRCGERKKREGGTHSRRKTGGYEGEWLPTGGPVRQEGGKEMGRGPFVCRSETQGRERMGRPPFVEVGTRVMRYSLRAV